jgi:hypothetical protein
MSEQTNETGAGAPAWMSQLSGDLLTNKDLTSFPTISDMGKAYLDAKGKLGEAVFLPKTDEEKAAFYTKLGRPENPDKYQLDKPTLPEGMAYDTEGEKAFRAEAHKLGISQSQMAGLYAMYNARQQQAYESAVSARDASVKSAEAALKKEWGEEFKTNMELVNRLLKKHGGEELSAEFQKTSMGVNPALFKAFASIGKSLADDKTVIGDKPKANPSQEIPKTFTYENL